MPSASRRCSMKLTTFSPACAFGASRLMRCSSTPRLPRAAGADVRTGVRVPGLITEGGRVSGVDTAGGPIHGQLVVGADGRHSTVASLVGAREYHVAPAGKMFAWAYFEGVHDREGRARIGRRGTRGFLASPTDGDLYMAAVAIDMAEQAEFHADRDANFTAGIRAWPGRGDVGAKGGGVL